MTVLNKRYALLFETTNPIGHFVWLEKKLTFSVINLRRIWLLKILNKMGVGVETKKH